MLLLRLHLLLLLLPQGWLANFRGSSESLAISETSGEGAVPKFANIYQKVQIVIKIFLTSRS